MPTPLPLTPARSLGQAVGHHVAHADATLRGVGQKIHELWGYVRNETKAAVDTAKAEYSKRRTTPGVPGDAFAPPRRRSVVARVLGAPFRFVGWVFSNIVTVLVTLLVTGILIALAEIALEAAIE
jgi:hypothetical protein